MTNLVNDDFIYECSSCKYRGTLKEFHSYGNPSLRKPRTNDTRCPKCKLYRTAMMIGLAHEYVMGKIPEDPR